MTTQTPRIRCEAFFLASWHEDRFGFFGEPDFLLLVSFSMNDAYPTLKAYKLFGKSRCKRVVGSNPASAAFCEKLQSAES